MSKLNITPSIGRRELTLFLTVIGQRQTKYPILSVDSKNTLIPIIPKSLNRMGYGLGIGKTMMLWSKYYNAVLLRLHCNIFQF